jgi:hypothetical protein
MVALGQLKKIQMWFRYPIMSHSCHNQNMLQKIFL